jgi:hypothetical protein
MRSTTAKLLTAAGKAAVLAGIVYLVARNVDLASMPAMIASLQPAYAAAALGLMFLMPVVLALRLSYVSAVPLGPLVSCIVKSYFFNNFSVSQVGGDLYKVYYLSGLVRDRKRAIAFVAGDRLIGIAGLTAFAAVNVLAGQGYFRNPRIYTAVGLYLLGVVVVSSVILLTPERWLRYSGRIARLGAVLEKVRRTRHYAKETLRSKVWLALPLTWLSHAVLIGVNLLAMGALGLRIEVVPCVLFIPVIAIAIVTLPISFNGLGVRESLFVVFFGMAGYTSEQGLALAMVNLVGILAISLAGGVLVLCTGRPVRAVRAGDEADLPPGP